MCNCHRLFTEFNKAISLNARERRKLELSRDAIKRKIASHFKTKGYDAPEFIGQGSFTMGTSIRPLKGYYDLDMGVCLHGLGTDSDDWPKTETIHNLIYNAVAGHTSIKPVRKLACIRVVYKSPYMDQGEISYHIDLPVYAIEDSFWNGQRMVIGFRGDKQWSESSDLEAFAKWFLTRCQTNLRDRDQLKRIVKYLKAWKENQPTYPKLPSGMILTVLAAKNFKPDTRDDVALIKTVEEFNYLLGWMFSIKKPTVPESNLAEFMTDPEIDNFMSRLEKFAKIGRAALESKGQKQSAKYWQQLFGSRFLHCDPVKLLAQ